MYLGNEMGSNTGFNGDMKEWHLCLGSNCAIDGGFEDLNCAEPIETADPEDPFSLGVGMPGCGLLSSCSNGLPEPCEPETEPFEGSAQIEIEWPEIDPSDLIA